MFANLLGDTMKFYKDDMLVKSLIAKQCLNHLHQAFDVLKRYNMKLNPTKCSFGVSLGKFLGYMVTQRGVEANPDQIQYVKGIPFPTCIKDIQHLTERVVVVSWFISRSSKKYHLFFATLHKSKDFKRTVACEKALQQLKKYLTSPPFLSKPNNREKLFIYLVVSETAICVILIRDEEGRQLPVYYVSKSR